MNDHRLSQFFHGKIARFYKVVILIAMFSLMSQPALANNGKPRLWPPDSRPYGKTYSQWSANWWKYVLSFPASSSPLNDATGENCGDGQSGQVFFLVGTTGGTAVRNECVVPPGKSIFFPIIDFVCAVPEDGNTAQEIMDLCSFVTDYVDLVEVTVDGMPVPNLLAENRFPSPIFSYTGAVDNPFDTSCSGRPAGECYEGFHDTAFADGYYVMLRPLPPGEHQIKFKGHLFIPEWGWEFGDEIIYNITVGH